MVSGNICPGPNRSELAPPGGFFLGRGGVYLPGGRCYGQVNIFVKSMFTSFFEVTIPPSFYRIVCDDILLIRNLLLIHPVSVYANCDEGHFAAFLNLKAFDNVYRAMASGKPPLMYTGSR